MNKKALELNLNVMIIAILLVIALIVIVTFFLGGFGTIKDTIARTFFPISTGTDLAIAIQTCEQRCDQARLLPTGFMKDSAFCKSYFTIDQNGNGLADRVGGDDNAKGADFIKFYCKFYTPSDPKFERSLGVSCKIEDKDLC